MRLVFLRHGETEINVKGGMHKTGDSACLTQEGIDQIKKCLPFLKENKVSTVYCSPEQRAKKSAELIAEEFECEINVLDNLRERDWGDWESKEWQEISQNLRKMDLKERYVFVPPNGESWEQMELRLKKALNEICNSSEQTICIVTHGGALRALVPLLRETSLTDGIKYDFENGSLTVFDYEDGEYKEIMLNNTGHLKS